MSLFKNKATDSTPNLEPFHISPDLFEDGGSYTAVDQGDGTVLITIISTKPLAIVSQDEWQSLHEELNKSRKFAQSLQEENKRQAEVIARQKQQIEVDKGNLEALTELYEKVKKDLDECKDECTHINNELKTIRSSREQLKKIVDKLARAMKKMRGILVEKTRAPNKELIKIIDAALK